MLFSKKGKSTVIILKKIKTQQGVTEFWVVLFLLTSFYTALKENSKPIFPSHSVLLEYTTLNLTSKVWPLHKKPVKSRLKASKKGKVFFYSLDSSPFVQ
jgi:hypothetical protein